MFKKIARKLFKSEISHAAQEQAQAVLNTASNTILSGGMQSGAKWPYGVSNAGRGRVIDHRTTRRNARNAYHENSQARAIVERYADHTADIGLRFESQPKFDILGISPEEAERWARNVEARFHLWASSKLSHRAENITFYQSHRLYETFRQRDNDIFIRLYYDTRDRKLLNPLQFEFIDPDQIRGDAFSSTYGIQSSMDGIERDERGREISYKIWIKGRDGKYNYVDVPRKGRNGRLYMLHGYSSEYAGQGRGYSKLGHAIQEFENLTDLSAAHIKKAINQSMIAMFNKPSDDKAASNPLEGVMTEYGAGPAAEQFGTNPTVSDDAVNTTTNRDPLSCHSIPEATFSQPGGAVLFNLDAGEELKPFLTAPADTYDTFVDAFTSYLSAASGMPLEVLLMKFNQNYSASRASLLLFWRTIMIERAEMAAEYLSPIFTMWLSGEIAAGRVMAPGWSDPIMRAAWLHGIWTGSPMPNIDPMRTAKADKEYTLMGAQTLDMVARNLNGSDGAANRAKLSREYQEINLPPWEQRTNG